MARRRIRGDTSFRRLLKQMEPAIKQEVLARLESGGNRMLMEVQARAPVRKRGRRSGNKVVPPGRTKRSLKARVLRGALKLKVGLIGKPVNRKLFYALIIEVGRKAGGRGVKRGTPKYAAGVGRVAKRPFVWANLATRQFWQKEFKGYWDSVLKRASGGDIGIG